MWRTEFDWAVEAVEQYVREIRPLYGGGSSLRLTERGSRVSVGGLSPAHFIDYREEMGSPEHLHLHCLRRSYVTHLIEDGFDPFFLRAATGRTRLGFDHRPLDRRELGLTNRVLPAALDRAFGERTRREKRDEMQSHERDRLSLEPAAPSRRTGNDLLDKRSRTRLQARGIKLSPAQTYRLVTPPPCR